MHVFGERKVVQLKIRANFSYLREWRQDDQKIMLLKVCTTWIRSAQIFLDLTNIQKRAPARSMHLEAIYLEALLYIALQNFFLSQAETIIAVVWHFCKIKQIHKMKTMFTQNGPLWKIIVVCCESFNFLKKSMSWVFLPWQLWIVNYYVKS